MQGPRRARRIRIRTPMPAMRREHGASPGRDRRGNLHQRRPGRSDRGGSKGADNERYRPGAGRTCRKASSEGGQGDRPWIRRHALEIIHRTLQEADTAGGSAGRSAGPGPSGGRGRNATSSANSGAGQQRPYDGWEEEIYPGQAGRSAEDGSSTTEAGRADVRHSPEENSLPDRRETIIGLDSAAASPSTGASSSSTSAAGRSNVRDHP